MFKITFLKGDVPLTKTIRADGTKSSYPNLKNFTSTEFKINTLAEFHKTLVEQANSAAKPCLLKGNLSAPLKNQPRKGMMPPNTQTNWVCFDLDGAPFSTPDEFMKAIGLGDVSYIMQYSSSHGLTKAKTLNCHIFALLSQPVTPQNLKAWLMYLNLQTPVLERAITLSASHMALHWSLDITTCQNDKLLYIATPIFVGMKDPLVKSRIQLIQRPTPMIDTKKIVLKPIDTLKKQAAKKRDELRTAMGFDPVRAKIKIVDDYTIQPGASEASSYEIVEQTDEYTRININGGDSAAYWFYNNDPELIRNFKGEDFLYMKEVLPDLYKQLKRETRENNLTPSANGDLVLAFREKRTGQYWKGLFNADAVTLDVHPVDSKDKLFDFLQGHGLVPPPYVPEWELVFDPQSTVIVDEERHVLNRFTEPPMLRQHAKGSYPIIQKVLDSAVGIGEIQEHFLNWLAVIVQHKRKTGTAWILHGTQGTGKGILFTHVLTPLLTKDYTEHILATALASDFDGWQENKLLVFIDEIDVDMFEKKSGVEAKLKKMVTENTDDIHRKGVTRYTVPSFVNLIFGSNKPQPVAIPYNDRRYNVGQYQSQRWMPTRKEIEEQLPKELSAFAHYLMTRKACIDTAREVLHTEDRDAMQALSITSVDELAHDIKTGDLDTLMGYLPDTNLMLGQYAEQYHAIMKNIVQGISTDVRGKLTRDQLQIIFGHAIGKVPDGAHKFTSYLRHHGINLKKIRFDGVLSKGIEVKWQFTQQQLAEWMKRFNPKQPIRRVK